VVAFVGSVVPDEPRFRTNAYSPAGNTSQTNLIRALAAVGVQVDAVVSFVPVAAFPRDRHWYQRGSVESVAGIQTRLLPFINVVPLKFLHLGLGMLWTLLSWSWRNRRHRRVMHLYNVSRPPGVFAYAAARLTGAAVTASLYDVGVPGVNEANGIWQRLTFRQTRWLVPRLDGRVVITPRIAEDFGRGQPCLVVDGGVPEEWIACFDNDLPRARPAGTCTFLLAGSLWEGNGIRLVLDAFAMLEEPGFALLVAGRGELDALVERAAAKDTRIRHLGFLDAAGMKAAYREADVLLNIRLTKALPTPYHFPSKLIEYLATGRVVISTAAAHVGSEYGAYCFLLDREEAPALAQVMRRTAQTDREQRDALGARARAYVRAEKAWSVQARRIAAHLAAARGSSRSGAIEAR
jgi:glycosyltransferase involved in cell wall biosynthesis